MRTRFQSIEEEQRLQKERNRNNRESILVKTLMIIGVSSSIIAIILYSIEFYIYK
jgi:hypothetical protein